MKNGETARARTCFERGIKKMIDNGEEAEELLVAFAEFEEQSKRDRQSKVVINAR